MVFGLRWAPVILTKDSISVQSAAYRLFGEKGKIG